MATGMQLVLAGRGGIHGEARRPLPAFARVAPQAPSGDGQES